MIRNDEPASGAPWAWLAAGAAGVAASLAAVRGAEGLFGAALALTMTAIALSDVRRRIIPDLLSLLAGALGLVRLLMLAAPHERWPALQDGLLRALVSGGTLYLVRKGYQAWRGRAGLGLGDVKLGAVAGLWLSWRVLPIALDIAAIGALLVHVGWPRLVGAPIRWDARLPFGLYMAGAIWLGWLIDAL